MQVRWMIAAAIAATSAALVAAAPDWSKTVERTPLGSFVQGNPQAKVKLVEYISFTCNHCAAFYGEAAGPLDARVKAGGTSVEFRHAVRDPLDLAASLLARCAGPSRFHGHATAILAAQPQWLEKGANWHQANAAALPAMSLGGRLQGYADGSGLTALMRARGMPVAAARKCLADTREQTLLAAMAKASFATIRSTPSFAINGAVVADVHDWAALEPALVAAGAQ